MQEDLEEAFCRFMEQKWTASLNVAAASKEAQRLDIEGQRKPAESRLLCLLQRFRRAGLRRSVGLQRRWSAMRRTPLWKCKAFGDSSPSNKGQDNTKQRDVSILVTAEEEGGLLHQRTKRARTVTALSYGNQECTCESGQA